MERNVVFFSPVRCIDFILNSFSYMELVHSFYGFRLMIKNGYSQPQEFEADALAVKLLADTGYSPNGLLEMLNILKTVQSGQSGGFLSTHPSSAQRIANIEGQSAGYKTVDNSLTRKERFLRVMGGIR